jgi:hypothetical protein
MNKEYWRQEMPHPYSPDWQDYRIYKKNLIKGSILLLGCTHKLLKLSDYQLDIDPWYEAKSVRIGNWLDNQSYYTNIIGDGVLNFTKHLTDGILEMCSAYCHTFVARSFNYKLLKMKYAAYFPSIEDFSIKPHIANQQKEYTFYVWNFTKS